MRRWLAEWDASHLEDTAILLVTELVTNAVLHARSESLLAASYDDGVLRVEVSDNSDTTVQRRHYGRDAGTGRGLVLVDAMSTAWGSAATEDGKTVWFELDSDSIDSEQYAGGVA
jgi:anti-sigma regulatory factor (Ser/Thr protein kinase)